MKSSRFELDFFQQPTATRCCDFLLLCDEIFSHSTTKANAVCCPLRGNFEFWINQRMFFCSFTFVTFHHNNTAKSWRAAAQSTFCIWTIFIFIFPSSTAIQHVYVKRVYQPSPSTLLLFCPPLSSSCRPRVADDEPEVSTLIHHQYTCRETRRALESFAKKNLSQSRTDWSNCWACHRSLNLIHHATMPRSSIISFQRDLSDDVFELFFIRIYYEIPKNR